MSDKWGISLSVKFQGTEDLKTYVIGVGGGLGGRRRGGGGGKGGGGERN